MESNVVLKTLIDKYWELLRKEVNKPSEQLTKEIDELEGEIRKLRKPLELPAKPKKKI